VTAGDGNYSFTDLAPGTYSVCETQQTNWVQTYPAGNTCHTIVINLSGETNEANFGNQGRGNIVVIKNVDTDGDGDVDEQDVTNWTWDIDGSGNFATGSGNTQNVAAGDYTVSEDQKENYHVTASSCTGEESNVLSTSQEVSVGVGETVTCTFTNTRDTATITIVKDAIPFEGDTSNQEFGFNFDEDSFTLADNGVTGDNTKTYEFVKTGESYDITEDATEGWTLDSVVCDDGQEESEVVRLLLDTISGNVTQIEDGVTVTPEADEHITCVFTNSRDTGTVTVNKVVTPSTDQGMFNLNINGTTYATNVGDGGTTGAIELETGDVTANETAGTNTNLADYESSYNCVTVGGGTVASGTGTSIDLTLAKDQNIVCTFTNNKGEILGVVTPLVNTGNNILSTSIVSLALISTVVGLTIATRRRNPSITFIKR
jgi:hypothetical protein